MITVIERGQARGELSASEDPKALVASVMGPLLYRRYFSRESFDEGFAREVVERLCGRTLWEFAPSGRMPRRFASINDAPISRGERKLLS